jgi:hypothetical protein
MFYSVELENDCIILTGKIMEQSVMTYFKVPSHHFIWVTMKYFRIIVLWTQNRNHDIASKLSQEC